MKVEIKNRITEKVMLCGEYESIKDCLEKNRGAYLGGAYLGGAYLGGADLGGADLGGAYLRGADLGGADLGGADLRGADLGGAYLRGAYLGGAYLRGAYLRGTKNYSESHDIFMQLIRNSSNKFSKQQQEMASRIFAFRLCWDSLKKEYGNKIDEVFNILAELGWDEYKKKWEKLND